MRIALVIERFQPGAGGVENAAWNVARALVEAGDEVHAVARQATPAPGVALHQLAVPTAWQPLRVTRFSRAAARAAPRGEFDVVYSLARTAQQDVYRAGGGSHASYLERRYSGRARSLRRLSPRHAVLLAMERRVFGDPTQIVQCNSEMVRTELQQGCGVPAARLCVIRNGVDLERYHPRHRESLGRGLRGELGAGDAPLWLFAGSGFERKGFDTALRALAGTQRRDSRLLVAGADRLAVWRRRAGELGLSERVLFLGYRSDMAALYAVADALLLPTRYDASANACLEAAASGTPVITSSANGAAEALDGGCAIVDDPEDVAGFTAALDRFDDRALRVRLGLGARSAVEGLGWDAHAAALRALFAGLSA